MVRASLTATIPATIKSASDSTDATATQHVKDNIVRTLQLTPAHFVVLSLNRPNIRYSVQTVSRVVHTTFRWLLLQLKAKRTALPKVIVFCRSINTCTSLYKMFITELQEESYEPFESTANISLLCITQE